ncbi:hypothetical protein ACH5RR_005999 [Cinchona calisaya]|uniref:valine--tRNA ligase n=1 Tax=Cinchona calisaya TaxID=153742 RepID=A0ABD3AMQ8_9GENT
MAKAYNPSTAENSWYAWWENSNFFIADGSSSKPPFVIVAVEQKLKRERNKIRHYFTRQEFVDEVWKWINEYGDSIQLWRLGASLDWSHEGCLVNWDCVLRTAISSIVVTMVDHTDIKESTAKRSLYEDH